MYALVKDIKASGEDFEFYPTTDEIIFQLIRHLKNLKEDSYSFERNFNSILDIGAGTGKVLKAIGKAFDVKLYAIEKANTLKQLLDESVYIIGTDFHQQSLIDKTVDVTFCNPPYSEYEKWATKILRESCSQYVFLVIPTRWTSSIEIQAAIKFRDIKHDILGEYTFKESRERPARAVVNLVRFKMPTEKEDSFQRFFDEEFKELKEKFEEAEKENPKDNYGRTDKENKFAALVLGKDYVKNLVTMYENEMNQIKRNYLYVKELDADLLKEFDINPQKIMELLKERLKNLKILYWEELISRMKEITDKLIHKKRNELLSTLNQNGYVDFTEQNIYAVVLWILKHAGEYIDEQLLIVYDEMISKANCKLYKSNTKVFENDNWRYMDKKPTHIFLDYRLVLHYCGGFDSYQHNGYRLDDRACEYMQDVLTVANNLGFKYSTDDPRLYRWSRNGEVWSPGKPQIFSGYYKGERVKILEVKVHKNRNIHVRLNQKFALALNVEYGRLRGWIHNKEEASEEIQDPQAGNYFKTNYSLLTSPFAQIEHKPTQSMPKLSTEYLNEKINQESLLL